MKLVKILEGLISEVNENDKPTSVAQVNRYIRNLYPKNIYIIRGKGYFWIDSNDEETSMKISGLYSSSLEGMWPMGNFTYKQWKESIDATLKNWQDYYENPVFDNL